MPSMLFFQSNWPFILPMSVFIFFSFYINFLCVAMHVSWCECEDQRTVWGSQFFSFYGLRPLQPRDQTEVLRLVASPLKQQIGPEVSIELCGIYTYRFTHLAPLVEAGGLWMPFSVETRFTNVGPRVAANPNHPVFATNISRVMPLAFNVGASF